MLDMTGLGTSNKPAQTISISILLDRHTLSRGQVNFVRHESDS